MVKSNQTKEIMGEKRDSGSEGQVSPEQRIGVIGIVVEDRRAAAPKVNQILSDYGDIIVGRMGVPYRNRGISVIALIVDGDTDTIGAMAGKLGAVPSVKVKTALTA